MVEKTNSFDLKLLTSSKEIGLRRLRSYAASLGAGAQIYNSYDDLFRHLSTNVPSPGKSVVIHDGTITLQAAELENLTKLTRVFLLSRPDELSKALPPDGAPCWGLESYMRCSLNALLDSPIMRVSMSNLCKPGAPVRLDNLLRWGHASQLWHKGDQLDVAEHGLQFVKSLNLVGESRRLAEMFSHFLQSRIHELGLTEESVIFGADGLLTMVVARCKADPRMSVRAVTQELKVHEFTVAVLNRSGPDHVELAALYYPFQNPSVLEERIVMVLNKKLEEVVPTLILPVPKAG